MSNMASRFAITGVAGYIAPRHLKAIKDTGSELVAAADPNDSVGVLDQFGTNVKYFPEIERFDRFLDKLRRQGEGIDYLSVCAPNYLHDAHIRLALRNGAHALCEKPLVINPWNLDALADLEQETGRRVYTILQLRLHPALLLLHERLSRQSASSKLHDVVLSYVTARGPWYSQSWKGKEERSGGIAANIGIHFFDMLLWLFGEEQQSEVHLREPTRMSGHLRLKRANVSWFLSIDPADLPFPIEPGVRTTHRSILVDGEELEFTGGFTDLHSRVYGATLNGQGFGLEDARPAVELVHHVRTRPILRPDGPLHPLLDRRK